MTTTEHLMASGHASDRLSLPTLQSKMKTDPQGYEEELKLLYAQFNSSLDLFKHRASLTSSGVTTDPSLAKELGERAMFLSHITPFYRDKLVEFPNKLKDLLWSCARSLPSGLRCQLAQALILLVNRQIVDIGDTLELFMEVQTLGDRTLKKLASSHVIHSIKRMNKKHKNEAKNRVLQNILYSILQQEDEAKAKRSLSTLCELHRRRVWFDERTANAICMACFHPSSRIMIAAISFLLNYEKIEDDDDSDASSSEDEKTPINPQVILNREAIYKANHKGTSASKKKKKAKLQRAMRSMKRQQRLSSENTSSHYYSPLSHLKDAQGFAEKLFSRLQTCNERFEVKMMMLKVISRTIGLHRLILLNFYSYLLRYVQPHQRDITNLLASAVQACHDMVPPDAVEPVFRQIVNQFVHDRSRPEAIAVGLNVVREICLRMPLLMTEELLQDLALYKKSHEKAVSAASRSLIMLFREVCPSLLVKKDRGRPTDPKAKPKAYGEVDVASEVPGAELLNENDSGNDEDGCNDGDGNTSDQSLDVSNDNGDDEEASSSDDEDNQLSGEDSGSEEDELQEDEISSDDEHLDGDSSGDDDEEGEDSEGDDHSEDKGDAGIDSYETDKNVADSMGIQKDSKTKKRKFTNFDGQLIAAETSLRALKRLAGDKMVQSTSVSSDGILSNDDFRRIKELQAEKDAKDALSQHGLFKNSDQLTARPVNPDQFDAKIRRKPTKDEKLALIKAGREDRGKYQARTAVKQKKTGGLSNQQKEHKKAMPLAAKRAKIARTRQEKKIKKQRAGKQFRGRKAWK